MKQSLYLEGWYSLEEIKKRFDMEDKWYLWEEKGSTNIKYVYLRNNKKDIKKVVGHLEAEDWEHNWDQLISSFAEIMGYKIKTKDKYDSEMRAWNINFDGNRKLILISPYYSLISDKIIDTEKHAREIAEIIEEYEGKLFGLEMIEWKYLAYDQYKELFNKKLY